MRAIEMVRGIKKLGVEESGADIVEYTLMLVLLGAAAVFVLAMMGGGVSAIFGKLTNYAEAGVDGIR